MGPITETNKRAKRNERNEMKICNLRNVNMLMICKIEIANYRFKFSKLFEYFHFANYRFLEICNLRNGNMLMI